MLVVVADCFSPESRTLKKLLKIFKKNNNNNNNNLNNNLYNRPIYNSVPLGIGNTVPDYYNYNNIDYYDDYGNGLQVNQVAYDYNYY